MLARLMELVVIANVVGGFCGYLVKRQIGRRRTRNAEHVRELLAENEAIDEQIAKMKGR